jgi:hypothetical protein
MQLNETTCLSEYSAAGGDCHSAVNQRILSRLVHREVMHCLSCTVSHFLQNPDACCDGIDYDDIISELGQRDDWETPGTYHAQHEADRDELIEWLIELDVKLPNEFGELVNEDDPATEDLDEAGNLTDDELRTMVVDNTGDWQEYCDKFSVDHDTVEAYEHWAVTSWFKARLAERGEITGDLLDFDVWGRTCTGQAISMDYVIASIAAEMQILDGQSRSWAE